MCVECACARARHSVDHSTQIVRPNVTQHRHHAIDQTPTALSQRPRGTRFCGHSSALRGFKCFPVNVPARCVLRTFRVIRHQNSSKFDFGEKARTLRQDVSGQHLQCDMPFSLWLAQEDLLDRAGLMSLVGYQFRVCDFRNQWNTFIDSTVFIHHQYRELHSSGFVLKNLHL